MLFRTFDLRLFGFLFPLPLSVSERLRFVIVALPGLFSYLFVCAHYTRWSFGLESLYLLNLSCLIKYRDKLVIILAVLLFFY